MLVLLVVARTGDETAVVVALLSSNDDDADDADTTGWLRQGGCNEVAVAAMSLSLSTVCNQQ